MMQWLSLVFKSLLRNKRRSLLTLGAMALALFVILMLQTVITTLSIGTTNSLGEVRVAVIEKYTGPRTQLPASYGKQLEQFTHVNAVTPMGYTVFTIGENEALYVALLVDPSSYRAVFASTAATVPPHQYACFIDTPNGVLVGTEIMEKYGWQIGDRITGASLMHKIDVPLVICGTFGDEGPNSLQLSSQMLVGLKYYEDLRGPSGKVNLFWLRLDKQASVLPVMQLVENYFSDESQEVAIETERAMLSQLSSYTATIKLIIQIVSGAVLFTILIVTANTMALSMRERKKEIAVMKAIGFTQRSVIALVVSESIFTALIGGSAGALAAYMLFTWSGFSLSIGLALDFYITGQSVFIGFLIALAIGTAGGFIPAYRASRVNVVTALSSL